MVLGFLLIPPGILGIVLWIYLKRNPQIESVQDLIAQLAGISKRPAESILNGDILPTDSIEMFNAPTSERLEVVQPNQMVKIAEESEELTVKAKATLTEMWQVIEGSSPWIPKPHSKQFTIVFLTNGSIFARVRTREGGASVWLRSLRKYDMKLMRFFIGGNGGPPGPARIFRKNGQETPVAFSFPGSIQASGRWLITDIGRYKVDLEGRSQVFKDGDYFPFVLARQAGGDGLSEFGEGWALYLDQRSELAAGTGGLFILEEFSPDMEVEQLL